MLLVHHLFFSKTRNLSGGLEEVNLEEALEVEVGDLLAVLHAEELGELGIRDDAALEVGVKAVVGLDVVGDELGDVSLRALGLGGKAHERGELIRDGAELEEGVVCATGLPRLLLLGGHLRGILAAALLGVAGLTLEGLGRLDSLVHSGAHAGSDLRAEGLEGILESGEDRIGGASLGRGSLNNRSNGRGRGGNRHLGLGGGLATLGRGGGGGRGSGSGGRRSLGLLIGRHVCINGGLSSGHF